MEIVVDHIRMDVGDIYHLAEFNLQNVVVVTYRSLLRVLHEGKRFEHLSDEIPNQVRRCRENPSLCADREAEPRGFWTGRIRSLY